MPSRPSMPRLRSTSLGIVLCALIATAATADSARAPADTTRPVYLDETGGAFRDEGAFLPDTLVLARVDDKLVRVIDFRERYFSSDINFRPLPDSLGRVEFLNSMIDKEVMGFAARAAGRDLAFEDRLVMREHTNTVLTNVLYQRMVYDSLQFPLEELERYLPQFTRDMRLQQIRFLDPGDAERVRGDLIGGRITWSDAARRYGQEEQAEDGELGWVARGEFQGALALGAFALAPGSISDPIPDGGSFYLIRALESRPVDPIPDRVALRTIARDLRAARSHAISDRIFAEMRVREAAVYDSANIRWAAARFAEEAHQDAPPSREAPVIDMRDRTPRFTPEDGERMLVRSRDHSLTLQGFLSAYSGLLPMYRPYVGTTELFVPVLDRFFFQPMLVEEALARGLDKDSLAVADIEKKREELLVGHLYEDSILARVSVDREQMRRYYEENRHHFYSRAQARYAQFVRHTEAAADSVLDALRSGADPEALVADEEAAGSDLASVREDFDRERLMFRTLLFQDMSPRTSAKLGPDRDGNFVVIHLIDRQDPRQMGFGEVEDIVRESLVNASAEKLLADFLARQRRSHRIEAHPELVMRIRLSDPVLDSF